MLKALFVLQKVIFVSYFFGYVEKQLDKKAMADFKIYDVQTGHQIIKIHTLCNIAKTTRQ